MAYDRWRGDRWSGRVVTELLLDNGAQGSAGTGLHALPIRFRYDRSEEEALQPQMPKTVCGSTGCRCGYGTVTRRTLRLSRTEDRRPRTHPPFAVLPPHVLLSRSAKLRKISLTPVSQSVFRLSARNSPAPQAEVRHERQSNSRPRPPQPAPASHADRLRCPYGTILSSPRYNVAKRTQTRMGRIAREPHIGGVITLSLRRPPQAFTLHLHDRNTDHLQLGARPSHPTLGSHSSEPLDQYPSSHARAQ